MSLLGEPKRYFINTMPDFQPESRVLILPNEIKDRILPLVEMIVDNQPPRDLDGDGGLYVGVGGIGFMYYRLSQSIFFESQRQELLEKGVEYISAALKYVERRQHRCDPANKPGFLLGDAGVYAVATAIYAAVGNTKIASQYVKTYASFANICKPIHFLSCGSDELFVGRAGYLFGLLWLESVWKKPILPEKDVFEICNAVIESGRTYAQRHKSPSPLMYSYYEVLYVGAAHGLCSILQALLSIPGFVTSNPDVERDVRASVDYVLSLQSRGGNFPAAMDELGPRMRPDDDELVHWCHGAPGVVYMMAKAYMVWKDDKYLRSSLRCGELVWTKGLLRKGPGICHGIAGNGYVFLLLYRLTNDERHWHRAQAFAQFLCTEKYKREAHHPDSPYSLYEGAAGTVCFLADLAEPFRAEFPLLNVF